MEILNQYVDNDYQVTEYTKDGTTVSHTVRTPIPVEPIEPIEPIEPQPTLEELQAQTLLNTELLLIYTEIGL